MKKKAICILLALAMALSLAACGGDSPSGSSSGAPADSSSAASSNASGEAPAEAAAFDEFARPAVAANEDVSIIYLISNMTDESNVRPENQVEVECAHRGWDFQVINYENEDNFRQYMDNAINSQPTAIIVGITQSFPSFEDLVAKARNAGIGVYSLDNSVIPGVISNATLDGAQAATELMDKVVEDHPALTFTYFERRPTVT